MYQEVQEDELINGDEILENHAIVMDSLEQHSAEEDIDEGDYSPIVHPVSVYNEQQNDLFGDILRDKVKVNQ